MFILTPLNATLVILILINLALIAGNLYFWPRTAVGSRSYFFWGAASAFIALIPTVAAWVGGRGHIPATDPNNFIPFVVLFNLFFTPASFLNGAIGWYHWHSGTNPFK